MTKPMQADARPPKPPLLPRLAAGLAVLVLVGAGTVARRQGVDAATLQRELVALGCLAPPLFLVLFAAGELLHLPGILFVVAARVVFGPAVGFLLGYAGALFAITVAFFVARRIVTPFTGAGAAEGDAGAGAGTDAGTGAGARREAWRPRWRWLRRSFERLEASPVKTVALLRLVLWFAPPLTYAIAATRVRARDHALGSALGLALPVLAADLAGGLVFGGFF
jgi:uncharacterized membrane protein YdjX (TVP38/TMEM64 family)